MKGEAGWGVGGRGKHVNTFDILFFTPACIPSDVCLFVLVYPLLPFSMRFSFFPHLLVCVCVCVCLRVMSPHRPGLIIGTNFCRLHFSGHLND